MFHFFVGTKAQFIKMAPIMVEMQKQQIPYRYIDSGQHASTTAALRRIFKLPEPDYYLRSQGEDITSISDGIRWYISLLSKSLTNPDWLQNEVFPGGGICLIHGDTLSTLLGLQLAKRAKLQVAHVEAGLRSYKLLDPFPEELIRIFCMKRSDWLFCPSQEGINNLERMKVRGHMHKICGNTVIDAINIFFDHPNTIADPGQKYCVATCHRLETITSKQRLGRVVNLLNAVQNHVPVIFVIHKPTLARLERYGLKDQLAQNIRIIHSLEYGEFLPLLRDASLVMTDGGSIQEECAYLNKPCIILRKTTERPDGLGKNAMLWEFNDTKALNFIAEISKHAQTTHREGESPSKEIISTLLEETSA